jgi:hypothetical protein
MFDQTARSDQTPTANHETRPITTTRPARPRRYMLPYFSTADRGAGSGVTIGREGYGPSNGTRGWGKSGGMDVGPGPSGFREAAVIPPPKVSH